MTKAAAAETATGGDEGLNKLIEEEEAERREKEIAELKAQQTADDDPRPNQSPRRSSGTTNVGKDPGFSERLSAFL